MVALLAEPPVAITAPVDKLKSAEKLPDAPFHNLI
jgi:hypothetical protein